MYAQLPVYKYQTFDQKTLTFSEHPIIPPRPRTTLYFGEGADADELTKNDNNPSDQPLYTEMSDSVIEIIDVPADGRCNFHFQTQVKH
jgi:hypothetical protein